MTQNKPIFSLIDFHAGTLHKKILNGVNLEMKKGSVHAIMGPNGSGKSTLAMSVMGHPTYEIKSKKSEVKIDGVAVGDLPPEERARAGLFVSFQTPVEITGVSMLAFLRTAYKELYPDQKMKLSEFKSIVKDALTQVGLDESFMGRSVNEGFSGGERKRAEIVQMLVLKPKVVILDEIDSGLDVDSLKAVAETVSHAVKAGLTVLVITHYQRILHFLKPDKVHVLVDGNIKKTGKMDLVKLIEKKGYAAV